MEKITPFAQWLASAPPQIQELARKYPPGRYMIAHILPKDQPYDFIVPGSIVDIEGYGMDGTAMIRVRPEDKTTECMVAERGNAEEKNQMDPMHYNALSCNVNPRYLIPQKA